MGQPGLELVPTGDTGATDKSMRIQDLDQPRMVTSLWPSGSTRNHCPGAGLQSAHAVPQPGSDSIKSAVKAFLLKGAMSFLLGLYSGTLHTLSISLCCHSCWTGTEQLVSCLRKNDIP